MPDAQARYGWKQLWNIATGDPDGVATIEPDPEDPYEVTLTWPDGSCSGLYWKSGRWEFNEQLNTCPGDVAARDTL